MQGALTRYDAEPSPVKTHSGGALGSSSHVASTMAKVEAARELQRRSGSHGVFNPSGLLPSHIGTSHPEYAGWARPQLPQAARHVLRHSGRKDTDIRWMIGGRPMRALIGMSECVGHMVPTKIRQRYLSRSAVVRLRRAEVGDNYQDLALDICERLQFERHRMFW